jgi:quercetin dioxygenase-like cupin family protein
MNVRIVAVLLAGVPLIAGAARAAEQIVPLEEEPQHQLKFQNQHVRLFDVLLPPGYRGIWHSHLYDGVFVNIEAAATRAQDLGADAADRAPRIVGETYFFNYTKKPKVHRVANIDSVAYRVTDTEILQNCGGFAPVKDAAGQSLIVENDRVRVTRVMIAPGETIALHPPCGMLVAVSGGKLKFNAPGGEELVTFNPAGFKWRDTAAALEFTNVGDEVFHAVDVVVK